MIKKDLVASLKTICARVYLHNMPQNVVYPAVTYRVINEKVKQSVKGDRCGKEIRFQVDIFSKSYSEAESLKEQAVNNILDLNGGDIFAEDFDEKNVDFYRQVIDFKIKE